MEKSVIKKIIENYEQEEKSIVEQLSFKHEHGTTIGGFREDIWKQMFKNIVPKKFAIEQSVFLIDSRGEVSKEVDLAIFDEMYTPYIFRKGRIKFIPIEAVAVAIQCKSTNVYNSNSKNSKGDGTENKSELCLWAESIRKLKTSDDSITRIATGLVTGPVRSQKATRPILILCSLKKALKEAENFDFLLYADDKTKKIDITIANLEEYNINKWNYELNMANEDNDIDDLETADPEQRNANNSTSNTKQNNCDDSKKQDEKQNEKLDRNLSHYVIASGGNNISLVLVYNYGHGKLNIL